MYCVILTPLILVFFLVSNLMLLSWINYSVTLSSAFSFTPTPPLLPCPSPKVSLKW